MAAPGQTTETAEKTPEKHQTSSSRRGTCAKSRRVVSDPPIEAASRVFDAYHGSLLALTALCCLYIVQLLVVDVAGIKHRHTPGTPVTADPGDPLFRASRAHANTNENFALFSAALLAAIMIGVQPVWVDRLSWAFVFARVIHSLAYWADVRWLRSAAFVLGLVATVGLIGLSVAAG